MKNLLALLIGLVLAGSVLVGAEYASRAVLAAHGDATYPLLYDAAAKRTAAAYQQGWGKSLVVSYLDPLLGFGHDPTSHPLLSTQYPGFVHYPSHAPGAMRIVALGGSTTDALTPLYLDAHDAVPDDPYNWPREMQRDLWGRGIDAEVFNGGVAGYFSGQQVLKLLRDVSKLQPDLILSLDGINDIGQLHRLRDHTLVHKYSASILDAVAHPRPPRVMPNSFALAALLLKGDKRPVKGVGFGLLDPGPPERIWSDNCGLADTLSHAFGARYVDYLQPTMGIGRYSGSKREAEALGRKGKGYHGQLVSYYKGARARAADMPYCTDLTGVFDEWDAGEVYLDARHYNLAGTRHIAEAIVRDLDRRGLLSFRRTAP